MNIEQARHNMIEQQIRPWDVLDSQVLELIASVPREDFVPANYRSIAFADTEIPLGYGQTMLPPKMEGKILQALAIQPGESALEIGTGSGYLTALLAHLAAAVTSIDIVEEFCTTARHKLEQHGIDNVTVINGDAACGWGGAYDVIVLTGSVPVLDESFKRALRTGGRLFAVVGNAPVMEAQLITRLSANDWSSEFLFETVLPPLQNAPSGIDFTF